MPVSNFPSVPWFTSRGFHDMMLPERIGRQKRAGSKMTDASEGPRAQIRLPYFYIREDFMKVLKKFAAYYKPYKKIFYLDLLCAAHICGIGSFHGHSLRNPGFIQALLYLHFAANQAPIRLKRAHFPAKPPEFEGETALRRRAANRNPFQPGALPGRFCHRARRVSALRGQ